MVAAQQELFARTSGIAARTEYAGIGEGGDRSLVIDRAGGGHRLRRARAPARAPAPSSPRSPRSAARSRSATALGDAGGDRPDRRLAQRPAHDALVRAQRRGRLRARRWPTSSFGFVYDFGAGEEFVAERGAGARLDGEPSCSPAGPGYGLELVGLEATKPELIAADRRRARRARPTACAAIGSLAITLCYVAAGRFDGMLSGRAVPLGRRRRGAADRARGRRRASSSATSASRGAHLGLDGPLRRSPRRSTRRCSARCSTIQREAAAQRRERAREPVVDWGLAERAASTVIAGLPGLPGGGEPPARRLRRGRGRGRVRARRSRPPPPTPGSAPVAAPPAPELVDRREWARNALATLAEAARPLEARLAGRPRPPGPARRGSPARGVGRRVGAEAGLAAGYAARRVLGQYDVALFGPGRPARLLFVAENLEAARRELDADRDALPALGRAARDHARDPVRAGRVARRRTCASSPAS